MMAARKPEQLRRRAKRWPLTQDNGAGGTAAATGYSLAERHGREAKLYRCCWVLADCTHGPERLGDCCSCDGEPSPLAVSAAGWKPERLGGEANSESERDSSISQRTSEAAAAAAVLELSSLERGSEVREKLEAKHRKIFTDPTTFLIDVLTCACCYQEYD